MGNEVAFMISKRIVELLERREKLTDLQARYRADDDLYRAIRIQLVATDDELIFQRANLKSIPEE